MYLIAVKHFFVFIKNIESQQRFDVLHFRQMRLPKYVGAITLQEGCLVGLIKLFDFLIL